MDCNAYDNIKLEAMFQMRQHDKSMASHFAWIAGSGDARGRRYARLYMMVMMHRDCKRVVSRSVSPQNASKCKVTLTGHGGCSFAIVCGAQRRRQSHDGEVGGHDDNTHAKNSNHTWASRLCKRLHDGCMRLWCVWVGVGMCVSLAKHKLKFDRRKHSKQKTTTRSMLGRGWRVTATGRQQTRECLNLQMEGTQPLR